MQLLSVYLSQLRLIVGVPLGVHRPTVEVAPANGAGLMKTGRHEHDPRLLARASRRLRQTVHQVEDHQRVADVVDGEMRLELVLGQSEALPHDAGVADQKVQWNLDF